VISLPTNKSLGQHWLKDRHILESIADAADVNKNDTILEVGPGLGTLTSVLLSRAKEVSAVELDDDLARKLPEQFPGKELQVLQQDVLHLDTSKLPHVYKVVANVPYYITSKIIRFFTTCTNPPISMTLLVQKEVAERICAQVGDMSVLAIASQVYWRVSLGPMVEAKWFTPPPKVDSQVVVMHRREKPLVDHDHEKTFFRVVRAGFGEKRKKLRSSLAGGLALDKVVVDQMLSEADIAHDARAQELSVDDWLRLSQLLEAQQSK